MSVESEQFVYQRRPSPSRSSFSDGEDGGDDDRDDDGGILYMRSRNSHHPYTTRMLSVPPATSEPETRNPSELEGAHSLTRVQARCEDVGADADLNPDVDKSRERLPSTSWIETPVLHHLGKGKEVERYRAGEEEGKEKEDGIPLRRYSHRFFSEELSSCRAAYIKLVVRATALTFLLIWAILPIYWGSLSAAAHSTGKLEVWFINRDRARIGDTLEAVVRSAPTSGPDALWWRVVNESRFPDEESVIQGVTSERTWAAVVVNNNASRALATARFTGDTTYDPSSAITVYYAQARNEVVTGTYLLPAATRLLANFTTDYASAAAQRYFAAIVLNDGSINMTALDGISRAPQTISPGIAYSLRNLRPYTTPLAQAPLLVGQIYICIFAFILVMAHSTARSFIAPYLSLPSYLVLRILTPLLMYFPLSLSFSLVSVAFKLPFGDGRFAYGAGFMAFFGFVYLDMSALGLALEAMITLLQPRFVPFFLVLLIVVNVSTTILPHELQPPLFAYGAGLQFWNIQQAIRTIFFNTYSHMGKNAGVLIAWVIISCCTTALFTWGVRMWEGRRAHRRMKRSMSLKMKGKKEIMDEENGLEGRKKMTTDNSSVPVVMQDKRKSLGQNLDAATSALERWERMVKNRNQDRGRNRKQDQHEFRPSEEEGYRQSRSRARFGFNLDFGFGRRAQPHSQIPDYSTPQGDTNLDDNSQDKLGQADQGRVLPGQTEVFPGNPGNDDKNDPSELDLQIHVEDVSTPPRASPTPGPLPPPSPHSLHPAK